MNEKMNGGISTMRGIFCRLSFQKGGITAETIAAQGFDGGIFSVDTRHMNESRFSNYFIEKWDLSYPRSLAIWGFPLFHVKAPILQNAPNAKLIFLCMAAI